MIRPAMRLAVGAPPARLLGRAAPLPSVHPAAVPAAERSRLRLLAGLGAASFLLYALLLVVVPRMGTAEPSHAGELFPWLPVVSREQLPRDHAWAWPAYLGLLGGLFGLYGLSLWLLGQGSSRRLERAVLLCGALMLLVQTQGLAMFSTDVYAYTLYGRLFALYAADPYSQVQGQFADDPFMPMTYFLPWPSWYGPLWTLLSGAVAQLVGERLGLAVLIFRLLAIGGALASAWLILAITRRLAPERAAQAAAFLLWNPLLVLETGLSGHNDAIVAALLLLGLWLSLRGRPVVGALGLLGAALIKLATGLLLPLYLLAVVRSLKDLPNRARFLAQVGLASLALIGLLYGLTRASPLSPVVHSASSTYFYDNNVYQPLFAALRVWLGEDPESAQTPVHFHTWWARADRTVNLMSAPRAGTPVVDRVRGGDLLLVIAPGEQRWVRAYNPSTGNRGYLQDDSLAKSERPHELANRDPVIGQLERNPAGGPYGRRANELIRLTVYSLFALLYLLAAWRCSSLVALLAWGTVALLCSYWLVATEIWPWYAIWALALAALRPTSRPALLAALLSATALTLYVTIGYERTPASWLFAYRSIPAFVLPLVLFAGLLLRRRTRSPALSPAMSPALSPAMSPGSLLSPAASVPQ
jgi:hypothetical protein